MSTRQSRFVTTVALATCVLGMGLAQWARAKDDARPPAATAHKKIDHPFVRDLLGTWSWTSTRAGGGPEEKGTDTFRLGLLETAVFEEIDGAASTPAFEGHGIWRLAPDGDGLAGWWFFSEMPGAQAFRGTLTAEGYDVKDDQGQRMTLTKTAGGLEMKAYKDGALVRTVTFTKK
jgi:hypothetical protein